ARGVGRGRARDAGTKRGTGDGARGGLCLGGEGGARPPRRHWRKRQLRSLQTEARTKTTVKWTSRHRQRSPRNIRDKLSFGRGEYLAILLLGLILGALCLSVLVADKFPNHYWEIRQPNFGFGADWECVNVPYGDPVCHRKPQ